MTDVERDRECSSDRNEETKQQKGQTINKQISNQFFAHSTPSHWHVPINKSEKWSESWQNYFSHNQYLIYRFSIFIHSKLSARLQAFFCCWHSVHLSQKSVKYNEQFTQKPREAVQYRY